LVWSSFWSGKQDRTKKEKKKKKHAPRKNNMDDRTVTKKPKIDGEGIELLNCTLHDINVICDGKTTTWQPQTETVVTQIEGENRSESKEVTVAARCETLSFDVPDYSKKVGVPVASKPQYGIVYGLPIARDDGKTGIIVSTIVAQAIVDKSGDSLSANAHAWSGPIFTPDSGPNSAIMDGKILIGVKRLSLWKQ
jgi:hypothetical protein